MKFDFEISVFGQRSKTVAGTEFIAGIIYRILDKIVEWCERYKSYKIKKSLPKGMSAKKWAELQKKSYK